MQDEILLTYVARHEITEIVDWSREKRGVRYAQSFPARIWDHMRTTYGDALWHHLSSGVEHRFKIMRASLDAVEQEAILAHTGFKDGDGI